MLGIVFVTLKLCHVINWSWWWVTAPFWGYIALMLFAACVAFAIAGVAFVLVAILEKVGGKAAAPKVKANGLRVPSNLRL